MEKQVNNKFIQPDPAKMEKVPAQMMIYDGSKWLEISNQQTINSLNDTTVDLQQEAKEVRTYVDNVDSDFKKAQKAINDTIETETTRLDKSISDAKLDTKSVNDRLTQINVDSQKTISEIQTNLSNIDTNVTEIDKKIDNATAESQKLIEDLQKQASDLKLNVADQFDQKSIEIQTAKQQAIANADQALKEYQTQVQTQFSNVDGKISQTVRKIDYDQLSKLVTANETRSIQNQNAIELKANKTSVDAANTKITDLESSLSVANDAIKARAKQTDVDRLTDRVSSAEASLTVNANNISLKADKASVDSLDQQVKSISSAMLTVDSDQIKSLVNSTNDNSGQIAVLSTQTQQNKDTIKTLATKTDLNALTNTVNQAKTEWSQSANGINASISQVSAKVDNITIGGRNYLQGSLDFTWIGGVQENNVAKLSIEPSDDGVGKMVHVTGDRDNGGIYTKWAEAFPNGTIKTGEIYTLSFDAKGSGNFASAGNESDWGHLEGVNLSNNWTRYTVTGTVRRDAAAYVIYFHQNFDAYIRRVKIEKGNKATDYTQAPEDIESKFNSVNNTLTTYKTDLDLLKDGMSLRVSEIAQVSERLNDANIQNLVYNSEFSNNAEGWTNIGNNSAGTILFSNNEWDSWQGSNGLAFRNSFAPTSTLVSQSKRLKILNWQRISASVQLHVTDAITNSCDAGMEIVFYPDETSGNEIKCVSQVTSRVNNISNGFAKLLYVNDVEVPANAKFATLRLWTYRVGNIIFNQPMMTFSEVYLPYKSDNKVSNALQEKYSALNVKADNINATVATKADKSYVDQTAQNITSVVVNKADKSYVDQTAKNITNVVSTKADTSYVNQKADQWQLALQNAQNDLSGKITATKNDLSTLYNSDTYKGMQKIVQNSAFLQNANGFTTQVQSTVSDELKQINLVYNSEFEPGNGQEIEGWIASHPVKRGTNMYDNYYGSTSLGMWTFDNTTDQWVNAWSQMIDVNEGDHLSASVVVFYTGGEQPSGRCGIEIELFEREDVSRKTWTGNYEDIANAPRDHKKTIRVDDYTIPSGITKARIGLVIEGKGNVMFAHPMLVKGTRAGIYQPSVVNKLSKLTQTLDGLKSEVHDGSINSVIGQTARMIALQISGDKNKVISQINASTEGIMIDGKHIMINGNTRIQGTLMVNDVVMKSQNNAVKFSPESLDMIGSNSMLKLQSDSIRLGSVSSDPRQQWGVGLDKNGLAFTIPVKRSGATTNNPSDYRQEIQGYINGGGWDYTTADVTGNGASGIEIGLMTQQVWGAPYGGDYIAIGQYTPTNTAKTSKAFSPAISYSETGFGWAPRDIHMYKPTTFHSEMHMNVPSTGYGIRTAWVSWSDWNNEKYPCFVNDTGNWGGIAFPSNGNVVMFNSAGMRFNIYETNKDKHYNGYGGN